ncbi:MAG: outer membrane protein assembly factor BamD [Elusimicrobiota bacterium]|mgnify:CR=1 FL=1
MTARALRRGFPVIAAVMLSSCVATQKDMLDLSQQSEELKTQIEELKKTVGSTQANQADLSVSIKQLREELTAYTETVKSSQGDMIKLSTKLDDIGSQLSGKVAALGQTISQAQTKGLEEQKAALAEVKREGGATDAFVIAEKRLQSKDYAQAAKGFEGYLTGFPKGDLTDVATYDLGLAYFGLKQWEKSGRQFAIVLDKYPKSGQTPGARLHYALALINLKKGGDEARAYLESLQADFPKSAEAKEASAVLKRLAKPKK